MFNLFKLFTYPEDVSNLQSQLIELQQAYKDLSIERTKLAHKVLNLEAANKDLDNYNTTLHTNFSKQEEFINKLKAYSEELNNLFFEDENRRYWFQ